MVLGWFLVPISCAWWFLPWGRIWILIATAVALAARYRRKVYIALVTLPRDLHLVYGTLRMIRDSIYSQKHGWSIPKRFTEVCQLHPDKVAFNHLDEKWTFQKVDDFSNRVGRLMLQKGLRKGDVVAVFLEGRAQYPSIWLGLSKIGVIAALINTNQRGKVLEHSLKVSSSKAIIYGTELKEALEEVWPAVEGIPLIGTGSGELLAGTSRLEEEMETVSCGSLEEHFKDLNFKDKAVYIFTSGTTGLPKAAILTHARYFFMSWALHRVVRTRPEDVVYTPLPLYHTAGGMLGISQAFVVGCTVTIRTKFSASNFWDDCIKYNCTLAQYIGETCRYLLATPPSSSDKAHKLRLMFGNGLRSQIWDKFTTRFNIKDIAEIYGSTEGNTNLVNCWNKIGAVGYVPWFVRKIVALRLVRVDPDTLIPIRDKKGLCIPCQPGEPGLLLGRIDKKNIITHYHGYVNKEESQKKLIADVFRKGDFAFNSGDVLVEDEFGYFYFRDRTGDTFRWKGENVSTTEVEGILSNILGLKDCVAYGVEVPNNDGRAGMAVLVGNETTIDFAKLAEGVQRLLPAYARPVFVRLKAKLDFTETFKVKKVLLQKEGFHLESIQDPLYFLDAKARKFVPLTPDIYQDILTGRIRL